MFHTVCVVLVMVVMPALCIVVEYSKKQNDLIFIICKYVLFWSIGVRSFTAGLMQFVNPSYTMKLLSVSKESEIIIRELGILQFGVSIAALLSVIKKSYLEPALLSYGVFMLGASYLHITRISNISFNELTSLIGDLSIVAITVIYFINKLVKKESKNIK